MIYLGKATPRVVKGLKSMSDEVDYSVYTSVDSFVQEAELRHLYFNRVVFNNKFVTNGESDFIKLNDFIYRLSSGTELVMVINDGDKDSEEMFKKYFTSPKHSCAIVKGAASMDFFMGIVTLPIPDVKARYYTLDKSSSPAVTVKPTEEVADSFLSGSKNFSKNEENLNQDSNISEPALTVESLATSSTNNSEESDASETTLNIGTGYFDVDMETREDSENSAPIFDAPATDLSSSLTLEDFCQEDEDDILSVGDFGYAHADTGLFDEDEVVDEVTEFNEHSDALNSNFEGTHNDPEEETSNNEIIDVDTSNCECNPVIYPYRKGVVNLVVSTSGSVSAQQVIDDAARITDLGLKSLIVDMDFKSNSVLSFIKIEDFYRKTNRHFSLSEVYEEDGVYLLSAGYGYIPSSSEIASVFSECRKKYDVIIVSCPISSFSCFDSSFLQNSNIIVVSGNDPCQIVETSLALTDRNVVSLKLERKIMNSHNAIIIGGKSTLVEEAVENMFFANGCWVE